MSALIFVFVIFVVVYCITGQVYFSIIEQSYKRTLTSAEKSIYKLLHIFDKLYSPYYHVMNTTYKTKTKHDNKVSYQNYKLSAFEDPENDWLTRQERDEAMLDRNVSEMLELKYEHQHGYEDDM